MNSKFKLSNHIEDFYEFWKLVTHNGTDFIQWLACAVGEMTGLNAKITAMEWIEDAGGNGVVDVGLRIWIIHFNIWL